MISTADLQRYIADRHAFRREQIVLPNGRLYGDVEEAWQRERVWEPLDSGRYNLLYYEMARGMAKTSMAAMEALTAGLLADQMEVFLFAGDEDQAGIALKILTGMIRANPDLSGSFKIGKTEITVPSTGTTIKVMSSDAETAFGIGGTAKGLLVVVDEFWVWKNPMLWEAIISSTGKVGDNWRVLVLSNAGIDGESKVAWNVREQCRTQADPAFYFWRSEGCIAGWVTEVWKAQQRALLTPGGYLRLIDNLWTSGESQFITAADWDALVGADMAPDPDSDDNLVYVGVDASKSAKKGSDTTAAVAVRREGEIFRLVSHRIWKPTGKGDIDLRQTLLPWLVDLQHRYSLGEIAYDPFNLSTLAQIGREAGLRMAELTQTPGNQTAFTGAFLDQVRSGGLRVYHAPDLREQVLNAVLIETTRGIRLAKEKSRKKIDAAVGLAMAVWTAQQHARGSGVGVWFGLASERPPGSLAREAKTKLRQQGKVVMENPPEVQLRVLKDHLYTERGTRDYYQFRKGEEPYGPQHVMELMLKSHPDKFEYMGRRNFPEDAPEDAPESDAQPWERPKWLITLLWTGMTLGQYQDAEGNRVILCEGSEFTLPEEEADNFREEYGGQCREIARVKLARVKLEGMVTDEN